VGRFVLRRLLTAIPVLIGILALVFVVARLIPGDPCIAALGERATDEVCDAYNERYGLNESLLKQFAIYLGDVLQGDLGDSFRFNKPVTDLLIERLPTTLELAVRGQSETSIATIDRQASADVAGPLPLLGLRYDYAFTPKWRLLTHAEYFALKIGGSTTYKGSMLNLRAATEYDILRNIALGVSYTYFAMDVDADDSDWHGRIDYKYYGPAIYVVAQF